MSTIEAKNRAQTLVLGKNDGFSACETAVSSLEQWYSLVYHPKDGVDNSTLREGLRSLPESLTYPLTSEESHKLQETAIRVESSGKEIPPRRRSFQWTANMFNRLPEELKELGVEPYDEFGDFSSNPELQLAVVQKFKKAAAGVVSAWAFEETRKVQGEQVKVTEETAEAAIKTFAQLEQLEAEIAQKLQEQGEGTKGTRTFLGQIAQRIPLTASTAMVVASLLVTSCNANYTPQNPDVSETQPRTAEVTELPRPGVTIVTEAPQPTVTQNFGLNGQDEENEIWPAVVDPYSYIQKRIEEGLPVIPAIGIPQDQWDEFEAQNPGAQVDELVSAIEQNLAQNGVTNYTIKVLTAAEGMGGGWVVEVRDEKGNLMWSKVTEGGLKRWADHPNFNPNSTDVRIQSIPESDNMSLVVSEENVIGVKTDKNGNITGIFQPVYNQIVLIPPEVAATLELKPNVPETLINESLDLLDPNPKKSESGDWVLTNKIGKTFYRWNPDTGQWVDERPLYWQCGLGVLPNSDRENKANIQNEEVKNLPTGLRSEEQIVVFGKENSIKGYMIRGCLTEINNSPGQTYIDGKVVFFDLDGKSYEYPVRMGNISGGEYWIPLGLGVRFRATHLEEGLTVLRDYWNDPSLIASRQIDMKIGTQDLGTSILDASLVNTNREITLQIIEAMRSGREFPREIPDNFFLWAFQLHFVNNSPAVWWFFDF